MKKNLNHGDILGVEDSRVETALSHIVQKAFGTSASKRATYIRLIDLVLVNHMPVDEKLTDLMRDAIIFNDVVVFMTLLGNRFDLLSPNIMPHIITVGQFEIWKAVVHNCSDVNIELLCLAVQYGQVDIMEDLTSRHPALVRDLDKTQSSIFRYVRDDFEDKMRNMLVPAVIKDTKLSMENLRRYLGELDGKFSSTPRTSDLRRELTACQVHVSLTYLRPIQKR
jgi:hypothetical protein